MSNENKVRLAHELLDEVNARQDLTPEQTEVLRSFLPKRPEQVTLEQVFRRANAAWANARGNEWLREEEDLEAALLALRDDLTQLLHEPKPAVPALPAGMRLAEHEEYGRCVVSPKSDAAGVCDVMHIDSSRFVGSKFEWAHECELTFIDAEPARPEFLETVEDYENAPVGTIVAIDGNHPWVKENNVWMQGSAADATAYTVPYLKGIRRVLRWGDA